MLGFLFGFNARLGRLHYFLATVAVAIGMTAAIYAYMSHTFGVAPKGTRLPPDLMTWPVIVLAVVFMWITFTLQSMRIRDIGWDPVCVIPGWIALLIFDTIVASKVPAWSLGQEHHGTAVGALVNFGLLLALTFWPSGEYESPTPTFAETRRAPDTPSLGRDASSATAARIARATGADFGRRSV
jgi:uncharacterized membrane protein YhaH (DUF805 family)